MLEVRLGGMKTYYLRYRNAHGKQKQYRIGDTKTLSFSQAKNTAQRLKTRISLGEDPEHAQIRRFCCELLPALHKALQTWLENQPIYAQKSHSTRIWGIIFK